jgi:hypothetical protein
MSLESSKYGRDLILIQYLNLAVFDLRRLPYGCHIAGESSVLNGAAKAGAKNTVSMAHSPRR